MSVSFCLPHLDAVSKSVSKRLFCFVQAKTLCRYGCMYFLAALVLVCVDVIVISLLLLFATTRSVFKSVKVSVVEMAKRTN